MKAVIICLLLPLALGFKFDIPTETMLRWEHLIEPFKLGCIQESGIDYDAGLNVLLRMQLPDDENGQCYLKCLAERVEIYDGKSHNFIKERVIEKLGTTEEMFEECFATFPHTEDCKIVHAAAQCIVSKLAVPIV
ncbi:hypothetical protein PPYR_02499 [Photinus pyralis]|uniref:Uncharacterized protein n=1 Tax=Photinus pyralis TaxID=7054 RepID=A0A5N4B7E9_PHOPY|nr:hypothetical protein PPYR_02499 [Photinus pyralis]